MIPKAVQVNQRQRHRLSCCHCHAFHEGLPAYCTGDEGDCIPSTTVVDLKGMLVMFY